MGTDCKGICIKYKADKPTNNQRRYALGQKRCDICVIFLWWDGNYCPCCKNKLRNKPRKKQYLLIK